MSVFQIDCALPPLVPSIPLIRVNSRPCAGLICPFSSFCPQIEQCRVFSMAINVCHCLTVRTKVNCLQAVVMLLLFENRAAKEENQMSSHYSPTSLSSPLVKMLCPHFQMLSANHFRTTHHLQKSAAEICSRKKEGGSIVPLPQFVTSLYTVRCHGAFCSHSSLSFLTCRKSKASLSVTQY